MSKVLNLMSSFQRTGKEINNIPNGPTAHSSSKLSLSMSISLCTDACWPTKWERTLAMESMSAFLTSWIQRIVRLEFLACSWSQAADLEMTESVTLPILRHSITWKDKVTGDTPEGGEDPGNAHELLQHPETLPPLTVEEELVYVGTAANRCIEVGTTALEHRHSHGGELGNKLVVERSVVQLVPLASLLCEGVVIQSEVFRKVKISTKVSTALKYSKIKVLNQVLVDNMMQELWDMELS